MDDRTAGERAQGLELEVRKTEALERIAEALDAIVNELRDQRRPPIGQR
jgi:hypothetical protein